MAEKSTCQVQIDTQRLLVRRTDLADLSGVSERRDERKVPVDQLVLDAENPRLTGYLPGAREVDVIQYLSDKADLEELIQSIACNGFLDIEPLIVTVRPDGKYLVVEGNRRVAAIKILRDHVVALEVGLSVPEVPKENRNSLESVRVIVVANRDDARRFIGFKHINGPHKWDSLAKGRFAADWYLDERRHNSTVSIRDIARRLGDRHDTVRRLVQGIFLLDQAEKSGIFNVSDRFFQDKPFFFSHLYTAIGRTPYREFLGIDPDWKREEPKPAAVPDDRIPHLKQVLQWLYGSREDSLVPVVTSQNPHVKQLGEVLANKRALHVLIQKADLQSAYAEVDTPSRRFEHAMVLALQNVEEANKIGYAIGEVTEELLDMSNRLHLASRAIFRSLSLRRQEEESGSNSDGMENEA